MISRVGLQAPMISPSFHDLPRPSTAFGLQAPRVCPPAHRGAPGAADGVRAGVANVVEQDEHGLVMRSDEQRLEGDERG